jgi:hypothetical protein
MPRDNTKALKNPLSQALGMIIKRQLSERNWDLDDFERFTGIKPNYSKSILQGQTSLHIMKAFLLYEAFKKENITNYPSLEGLINYLSLISILESKGVEKITVYEKNSEKTGVEITQSGKNKSYSIGLTEAAKLLSDANNKYKSLLYPFFLHDLFNKNSSDEVAALIESKGILLEVENFLVNYESYGLLKEEKQNSFFTTFFDKVPSIYVDVFNSAKLSLSYLPIKIHLTELWKWEDLFKEQFSELFVLVTAQVDITTPDNLEKYLYKYLWNNNFREINFCYYTTPKRSEEKLLKDFKENLEKGFIKSSKIPPDWKKGVNKVNFYCLDKLLPQEKKLLESDNEFYDVFWMFSVINSGEVAFVAKQTEIKNDNTTLPSLEEGKCLTVSEVTSKLSTIRKLLERVKNKPEKVK